MAHMLESAASAEDRNASRPRVPDEPPIDLAHLFLMTLGDRALEIEVLQLFDMQTGMLLARMSGAEPASIATLAHTIKGSARGIGAWSLVRAAEAVEAAAAREGDINASLAALQAAAARVRAAIADLIRPH